MADAAVEKQRIGDGGEVLGEEEQDAHIYTMGAFCPGWSPFVPGRGSSWDKRCFWAGRENSQLAAHL